MHVDLNEITYFLFTLSQEKELWNNAMQVVQMSNFDMVCLFAGVK